MWCGFCVVVALAGRAAQAGAIARVLVSYCRLVRSDGGVRPFSLRYFFCLLLPLYLPTLLWAWQVCEISMLFAVSTVLLQLLMELSGEMSDTANQMKQKTSPVTSSESDKGVDASEQSSSARKRRRRGKHRRKWKPYSSMTWEEKRELDARDAARAARREAQLAGKPSAPWNTTQFIMEDRGCNEVRFPTPRASRTLSLEESLSEEDLDDSPEDELFEQQSLLEQDFESTYQEVASERLQGLSKAELVEECLGLERELNSAREQSKERVMKAEQEVKILQAQLEKLQEELYSEHRSRTLPQQQPV